MKALLIASAAVAAFFLLFLGWLYAGVVSTQWAVDLVGGGSTLAKKDEVLDEDRVFLRSASHPTSLTPAVDALPPPCLRPDASCLDANLATANILSMAGKELTVAKEVIEAYTAISSKSCNFKVELSRVIYETSYLAIQPDDSAAQKLLDKIKADGGLVYSLSTSQCQAYLRERPYFSKAYLFYLSILMSMSNRSPESAWVYLSYRSGYKK